MGFGALATVRALQKRGWPLATCLLVSCLVAPRALAQAGPHTEIVVRYSGPRDCSSAREFIERASPRLPTLRFVEQGRDVGLEVVLTPSDAGVAAQLVIHLEAGGSLSRSILASSCDEATEAIAFVASVALDPGAQEPVVVQSADAGEGGSAGVADEGQGSKVLGESHETLPDERSRRRAGRRDGGSSGLLVVGAALGFGVGPTPLLGPDLALGIFAEQPGVWSPAFILGAQYLVLEGYQAPAGVASFHQGRGTLEFCPSLVAAGAFSFRPCVGLGGGWVQSEGRETVEPGQATRPYVDTSLGTRLALGLGRQSAIVLNGYVAIPWIRDSYRFDELVFHRTAAVTGGLALSIGARLW
jgi:hypothetical protein